MIRTILAAAVCAALTFLAAPAASAATIYSTFGFSPLVGMREFSLPGSGRYPLKIDASRAVTLDATVWGELHWDIFQLPPPRPHAEALDGNRYFYIWDKNATGTDLTWEFEVPGISTTSFTSSGQYGTAPGTTLYRVEEHEDPKIEFWFGTPDGQYADYWVTITAIPEPATWAMMIIGFGGAGLAIRASRRRGHAGAVAVAV